MAKDLAGTGSAREGGRDPAEVAGSSSAGQASLLTRGFGWLLGVGLALRGSELGPKSCRGRRHRVGVTDSTKSSDHGCCIQTARGMRLWLQDLHPGLQASHPFAGVSGGRWLRPVAREVGSGLAVSPGLTRAFGFLSRGMESGKGRGRGRGRKPGRAAQGRATEKAEEACLAVALAS